MAKRLLIETMPVAFEILEQASEKNKGTMKVRGMFGTADEINGNGRVYPEAIQDREIDKLNVIIEDRWAYSAADHPKDGRSTIENTAARLTKKIEKVIVDGRKTYVGEALILPTEPGGKNLQIMIATGGKVHVSQRGFGSLAEKMWTGKMADVVQEDYSMKAFDFVIGGSTKGAEVEQITEQMNVINLIEAGPCEGCRGSIFESQTTKGGKSTMEIKTLEELRKAYPELCLQIETEAKANREKELKEAMEKEWEAKLKEVAEGIKKQIEESEEYKEFKKGMELHKATLIEIGKLVKPYIAGTKDEDDDSIEEQVAALKTEIEAVKGENRALKEQTEREKKEAEDKKNVAKRIQEVTAGKEHGVLLAEELKGCLTVEEVDKKLPERDAFIKKLLSEKKQDDPPKGEGRVLTEDEQNQLDEAKQRDRKVAGLA